jgi:hypothetical protein
VGFLVWGCMALEGSINDREKNKFRDAGNNLTKVAVSIESSSLLAGYSFDKVTATYPTASTEQYEYTLASVLQATILITYTDSSKMVFTSAERTYGI